MSESRNVTNSITWSEKMKNPIKVGIWIRVSTDMQVRDESPEHHELRARHYIKGRGWDLAKIYRLDGVSGKTVMEHPEAQRMLNDVGSGQIDGLVFSKLSRLARNTKELLEFAEIFRNAKANLVSISENIDTSTPSGMLFFYHNIGYVGMGTRRNLKQDCRLHTHTSKAWQAIGRRRSIWL